MTRKCAEHVRREVSAFSPSPQKRKEKTRDVSWQENKTNITLHYISDRAKRLSRTPAGSVVSWLNERSLRCVYRQKEEEDNYDNNNKAPINLPPLVEFCAPESRPITNNAQFSSSMNPSTYKLFSLVRGSRISVGNSRSWLAEIILCFRHHYT